MVGSVTEFAEYFVESLGVFWGSTLEIVEYYQHWFNQSDQKIRWRWAG